MMNCKQSGLLVALALIAGFVGGSASNWFFMGEPVFAQKPSQPPEVIRAKRFEVVDTAGNTRAILGTEVDEKAAKARLKLEQALQELSADSPLAKGYRSMLEQIKTTERVSLTLYASNGYGAERGCAPMCGGLVSLSTSWETDPLLVATLFALDTPIEKIQQETLTPGRISWDDVKATETSGLDFKLATPKKSVNTVGIGIDASGTSGIVLTGSNRGLAVLSLEEQGPNLNLQDNAGFQMTAGNTSLQTIKTGSTENRTAASVVLFDKDKKVLWSAP
jgi:hypothetical protein